VEVTQNKQLRQHETWPWKPHWKLCTLCWPNGKKVNDHWGVSIAMVTAVNCWTSCWMLVSSFLVGYIYLMLSILPSMPAVISGVCSVCSRKEGVNLLVAAKLRCFFFCRDDSISLQMPLQLCPGIHIHNIFWLSFETKTFTKAVPW